MPDLKQRSRPLTDWLLLAGFCGFLFFFGLAYFGLLGADEPRYAQVAREMLARHDWITPTLGGKPWLEKPVLYYWEAMIAYSIFGVSDWAARLPSAVNATMMVLAVYLFLQRFRPGFQLDGALMTASAAGVIGFARAASVDMPLAATFTIALLAWYSWHESGRTRYLAVFYAFLGLGMLAKGPVAPILAFAIVAIFAVAKGEYRLIWRTVWFPGIVLFGAIALPWYVLVQLRNHDFFRVFIVQHNLARFGTDLYHHQQPFWYYLPVLLFGLLPWTVFVAIALTETMRDWWHERQEMLRSTDAFSVFLAIWLLVPVVFFSISQSKLPGYILPAIPAGAFLLAEYLRRHAGGNEPPGVVRIILHSAVAALTIVPALLIPYLVIQHRLPWSGAAGIVCVIAAMLAIAMAVTLLRSLGLRGLRFVTLIPVVLSVGAVLRIGSPTLDSSLSARPLAAEISRMESKPLPLAVLRTSRETEYGLQFYRNQTIARYELGQIPAEEHLLVAPEGSETRIAKRAAGRRVIHLGTFTPQRLDYYWVSAVGMEHGHSHEQ